LLATCWFSAIGVYTPVGVYWVWMGILNNLNNHPMKRYEDRCTRCRCVSKKKPSQAGVNKIFHPSEKQTEISRSPRHACRSQKCRCFMLESQTADPRFLQATIRGLKYSHPLFCIRRSGCKTIAIIVSACSSRNIPVAASSIFVCYIILESGR
jgi:hypothetical protein